MSTPNAQLLITDEIRQLKEKLEKEINTPVSIALFGQPGAGKSSLINKIAGKKLAEVGIETDKTIEAARYEINKLYFIDLPGYGTSSFPKESFFEKFKIMEYDLFLCVVSGKLHQSDTEFFQELTKRGKVCIFVVNKHDELWEEGVPIEELEKRKIADIENHVKQPVEVVFTSCRNGKGIDSLLNKIEENLEGAKKERWLREAKAYSQDYLNKKKAACEKLVARYAALSAVNAINPIPGTDVAIDIKILFKMFSDIRSAYKLNDDIINDLNRSSIPAVAKFANRLLKYATKEGIMLLLKRFAARETVKGFSKYIPLVGQVIASSIGFTITSKVGKSYLEDCHNVAEVVLKENLTR